MTKIASKPTVQKSAPVKNTGTVGTSNKAAPKANPIKSGAADTAKISKEASTASASSGVGGLISGLMSWGGSEGADAAKGAKEAKEAKPLELDKGQTLRKGASGDKVTLPAFAEEKIEVGAKIEFAACGGGGSAGRAARPPAHARPQHRQSLV